MKRFHFIMTLLFLYLVGSYIYLRIGFQLNYFNQGLHMKERKKFKLTNENNFELKQDAIYRQQVLRVNYRPRRNNAGINCTKIVNNDQEEIERSKQIMTECLKLKPNLTVEFYLNITKDCYWFRESRGYIEHPLSKMEFEFPVAFSILAYRDIEQIERLLRLIYRPHNYYCIHLDANMETNKRKAFGQIANCLNNVFIPEKSVKVEWGKFSVLEAELVCMNSLWSYDKWKYYINLTGQELPLKTNREIIAILKALNGANVVDGSPRLNKTVFRLRWSMVKEPPPIEPFKGSMHIAVNRFFVDFCLHDQRSIALIEWLKKTNIPDETLFSTLHHNPYLGIKGSAIGKDKEYIWKPYFLHYVIWRKTGVFNCHSKFVRSVCILGVDDIYKVYNSVMLFANKLYFDFEHIAFDCLEELLYERTWKEYIEDIPINTTYYSNLEKTIRFQKNSHSH